MKPYVTRMLIAVTAISLHPDCLQTASAQWQQLSGLNGEPMYWVRGTTNELFAVSANGAHVSSNNGGTWSNIPDLYLTNTVERISTSGDTVVAFAFPESYLSVDDGATWTTINNPSTGAQITDMIVEDGFLYAATAGDYFYYSSNLGGSWNNVSSGFGSSFVNSLSAQGSVVLASTEDGLYRSVNSGSTFTQVLLPGVTVNRSYISGTYAFAYSSSLGVYKSTDGGANWIAFDPIVPYLEIRDFCLDGGKVFAAAFDQLLVADTIVPNWTPVSYSQDITYTFSICKQGNTLFAGTNLGVFSSANQGGTWSDSNAGIIPVSIEALTIKNDTLYAGANVYGVSQYDGTAWEFSGLGLRNSFDLITRGNDLYSGSDFGIYKSSNSGDTWTLINGVGGNPLISFCPRVDVFDTLVVGAALQNGILRSGDNGTTWSFENTGMSAATVSCVAISGNNIVVGTYNDGLYTSADAGFTWSQSGAPGEFIWDLTTIGNNVIAASLSLAGNYVSTDNGATFNPGPTNMFDDLSSADGLVLGSSGGYIMISKDSGMTFQNMTPAPIGTQISGSLITATDVYVGTLYDGVWKRSLSEILSIKESPVASAIVFVHPNIFQTEAVITIDQQLAETSPSFIITDVSGKIVRKITLTQPRTRLEAGSLNAGIYFYHIQNRTTQSRAGKFIIH